MFETAELGQTVSDAEYRNRLPELRAALLQAQFELEKTDVPLIILFSGVDGAGKGDSTNLLHEWMDARGIETHAYGPPSDVERERPPFWRYWRDIPRGGRTGVFLSAWYHDPFLDRVHDRITDAEFDQKLDRILAMERTLAANGAVILKFWMHLSKAAQKARFERLEADPHWSWRVTEKDWQHWRMNDRFVATAERLIQRTSRGEAPWKIVEGADANFRSLEVGRHVLDALLRGLESARVRTENRANGAPPPAQPETLPGHRTILHTLDMGREVPKKAYEKRLPELQGQLSRLYVRARKDGVSTVLVFEGWDAAGKGGAIRRVIPALDARDYQVFRIAAPTEEELAHHYLWRFWRAVPMRGRVSIFDRSWYGRVLVERIEGYATPEEWRRAYGEINEFERRLTDFGAVVCKFWLHITPEEQEKRFKARAKIPYKQYKLTDEDWRNRERWAAYEQAVNEMVERTSAANARWTLVEGNDKRFARLKVLETVCEALRERVGDPDEPA